MTLKQALAIIITSIIIFLGAATAILGYLVIDLKKQNAIWQENLNQSLNERDQAIILQTEKQFAKLYPKFDSIAKANGIKNITHVHHTTYNYSTDSIITLLVPVDETQGDTNCMPSLFSFNIDTLCLKMSGIVDVYNQTIKHDNIELNDDIETFYFMERARLFDKKWTPKWGKWQYRAKSISECTDSISTLDIQIEKHK